MMCTELTFFWAITCLGGSFLVRKIGISLCFGAINLDVLGGKPHYRFLIQFIIFYNHFYLGVQLIPTSSIPVNCRKSSFQTDNNYPA